jgi:Protein of unknown function (DUF3558)
MTTARLSRSFVTVLAMSAVALAACTGSASLPPASSTAGAVGGQGSTSLPAASHAAANGGGVSSIDACSLLKPEEIQGALGPAMKPGQAQEGNGEQAICNWDSQDDSQSITVGVTVQPYDDSLWSMMISAPDASPVSGIGEAAYGGLPHAGDLAIKQNGREIDLAIIDFKDAQPKIDAADLALAKLVLSRL